MNRLFINEYINKITKDDIYNFGLKQNIKINNHDLDTIYRYIKNERDRLFDNPIKVINEVKDIVNIDVYNKILELYNKYKNWI